MLFHLWIFAVFFLCLGGTMGSMVAVSSLTATPLNTQYTTYSPYIGNSVLIRTVTSVDTNTVFSFEYVSTVGTIFTENSTCTINTRTIFSNTNFTSVDIRYVLIARLIVLYSAEIEITGSIVSYNVSIPNNTVVSVGVAINGWRSVNRIELVSADYFYGNKSLQIQSNVNSGGWVLCTVFIMNATEFTPSWWTISQTIVSSPTVIVGFWALALPGRSGVWCGDQCNIVAQNNTKMMIMRSNYNSIVYTVGSSQGSATNWLMISLVGIASLVALLLLVPTIKYARDYFCPVNTNSVLPADHTEQVSNDTRIQMTRVKYRLVGKPQGYVPVACCICLQSESNCKILPCGHSQYCEKCLSYISKNKKECSICRCPIEQIEYFSNAPSLYNFEDVNQLRQIS